MVAAIWAAPRAVELAESIRNTIVPEIHGRLVESYAVPAAMQAVLLHGRDVTREVAGETLRRMIGGRAALIGQGERDEVRLLRDILSSTVRVAEPGPSGTGTVQVERTVGQILGTAIRPNGRPVLATPNSAALTTVAAMGIRICKHHGSDQQRRSLPTTWFSEDCSVTRGGLKAGLTRFSHGWPGRSVTSSGWMGRCGPAVCHSRGLVVSRNWAAVTATVTTEILKSRGLEQKSLSVTLSQ